MKYDIDKLKKSKTFCLAPWMSIHNWPDGKVYPCCVWDSGDPVGNVNDTSLKELWNSEKFKDARVKMLNGEKVTSCSRCYELETEEGHSYRTRINELHEKCYSYIPNTNSDGSLDTMNLHLWDLRISNFCNFKCRSCGAELSSSWHADAIQLGKRPANSKALINVNDKTSFMTMIDDHYKCVDEIYFAGGEPLMMPEHYQIMDKLLELNRTDVFIRYSTNFSNLTFGKKHIFEYWKKFPKIELYISIDGVGEIGEYVRKGYSHQKFIDNMIALKNSGLQLHMVGYVITYGVLNYLHLFDMMLDMCKNGLIDMPGQRNDVGRVIFSPIFYPHHYDCRFLPDRYKEQFRTRLQNFDSELRQTGISEFFIRTLMDKLTHVYNISTTKEFNSTHMEECVNITNQLDTLRKEKFADTFSYFGDVENLLNNNKNLI